MNLQFKKVTQKSLEQNEGHLSLVTYGTNWSRNACDHSFPLPLIAYELLDHSTQISEHHHET